MHPNLKSILPHAAFIVVYVLLNWGSNAWSIAGLNIAPWNPEIAVGLVYWLHYGKRAALPWFAALMLAEGLLRSFPAGLPMALVTAAALTAGYGIMGELLRRHFSVDRIFDNRRQLSLWILIALAGTIFNATIFILLLDLSELVPPNQFGSYLLRFWAGDLIGILVQMPFFWMLSSSPGRARLRAALLHWETAGIVALAASSLWIIFWVAASTDFRNFYFLYLPVIWAATRQGLAGASAMVLFQQVAVVVVMEWLDIGQLDVFQLQLRGVILACVGLFIGVVVDELKLVTDELRQTMRLAAAGEMAAALAHELNQPMTALSAYGKACELLLARGESGKLLGDSIHRMILESGRAAEIVARLRDFFATGSTQLKPIPVGSIVSSVSDRFLRQAEENDVILDIVPVPDATVLADRIQIEIVLRNLLANAFDAVLNQPPDNRRVTLTTTLMNNSRLLFTVHDSGPGINAGQLARLFEPFVSTKSSGMGLGLVISRSIIEAHGGDLWAESGAHGIFKFSLQRAETEVNNAK